MYEVGTWFIFLLDGAILAVVIAVIIVLMFIKKNSYAKEAEGSIRAEIEQPTGWSKYFTIKCDENAKSVEIENFHYMLNPERRRWGMHPMKPFLGLSWIQTPIRIEKWYQDNPEPARESYESIIATAAEINATKREITATMAAAKIKELEASVKAWGSALQNLPNKVVVYLLCAVAAIASIACAFLIIQIASWL